MQSPEPGAPSGEPDASPPFRLLGERERFQGGFLRVVTGTFVGPDGFTFERDIVRHPGAVSVVPLEADRRHVILVRQYRAAVDTALLELPAGKLDVPGEPPEDCAARELAEEIGYAPGRLTELGQFLNSPGFSDERSWIFLAENLVRCERDAQGVEELHLLLERIDLHEFDDLLASGEIVDAKTIIGLQLARSRLRS
jgi:8-oxo-dGTP pyrophosphatase MutT (NUDIX family)